MNNYGEDKEDWQQNHRIRFDWFKLVDLVRLSCIFVEEIQ